MILETVDTKCQAIDNSANQSSKIFHMASMARSGETLVLKLMNSHPKVVIVHNLSKEDTEYKNKAFDFFKRYKEQEISTNHAIVKPYQLRNDQLLLLKQGVWKHPYPYKGFVLARNPISIYASLKAYDASHPAYDMEHNFWFENAKRLTRWMNDIAPSKTPLLLNKNPLEQFCFFYNERMKDLFESGLPIIRYEDLVSSPERTLQKLCKVLEIKMNNSIFDCHQEYEAGDIGHGQNDLSKPIDSASLYKYKENVSNDEFTFISRETRHVHQKFGYQICNNDVLFSTE